MADELAGKVKQMNGGRPATVVGHDIGAYIAYILAFDHPDLVRALVVINGVHPQLYQSALMTDPKQAEASKYVAFLRSQHAEADLSRNRFKLLLQTHKAVTEGIKLPGEEAEVLIDLWSQPGVLSAMLDFYRSTNIHLPSLGEMSEDQVPSSTDTCRIAQPHLLIWGENDPYLLASSIRGIETLCDDLTIVKVSDAGHGIVGSHPKLITSEISKFLDGLEYKVDQKI